MSVSIDDSNKITMTRGDTLRVKIGIDLDGEEYLPEAGDVIRFAMKRDSFNSAKTEYTDEEPLVLKVIPNDTLLLELDPEDTKPYGFGRYAYDVQITFADGTVSTFISSTLKLTSEVD